MIVGDTKLGVGLVVDKIVSVGATVTVIVAVGKGVEVGIGEDVYKRQVRVSEYVKDLKN